MTILAVDTEKNALKQLVDTLTLQYPEDEIRSFSDPMLAVKYGFNHQIDTIHINTNMSIMSAYDVVKLIQSKQTAKPEVVYIED